MICDLLLPNLSRSQVDQLRAEYLVEILKIVYAHSQTFDCLFEVRVDLEMRFPPIDFRSMQDYFEVEYY